MYRRLHLQCVKYFSTNVLKPYPSYVERQVDISINTTSGDELVEIDRETKIQLPKPSTPIRTTVNYIDTNPLGDKNQSIVLLVHGYPGTHESTKNLIEEFQRRNYRCIAPDMPCK
jgi:pimeloyl-ACP methyl ester carboxylesterase